MKTVISVTKECTLPEKCVIDGVLLVYKGRQAVLEEGDSVFRILQKLRGVKVPKAKNYKQVCNCPIENKIAEKYG